MTKSVHKQSVLHFATLLGFIPNFIILKLPQEHINNIIILIILNIMKTRSDIATSLNNKFRLFTFDSFKIIFWFVLITMALLKVYFITPNDISNDNFFFTYQFFTPDGYDWVVNAKYLFVSEDISYRQPGLVLIIKTLMFFNILGILPLINHIVLMVLLYCSFRLILVLNPGRKSEILGLVLVFLLYLNYYLQHFTNLVLADLYAVTLISLAFLALFKKKFSLGFLMLGISWTFQNFAPFILPAFILYPILSNDNRSQFLQKLLRWIPKSLLYGVIFAAPNGLWLLHKYFTFGNPFYTRVGQFELLSPNFDSLFYYGFNSLALFGLVPLIVLFYLTINYKEVIKNKMLLVFVVSIAITFIFWIIFYDWDDRRFLLYFLPYYLPLINLILVSLNLRTIYLALIAVLLVFNTTVIVPWDKFESLIPIVPGIYIERGQETNAMSIKYYRPRIRYVLPFNFLTEAYTNMTQYKEGYDTLASYYRDIITRNYDVKSATLCFDHTKFLFDFYIFNNVLKYMNKGKGLLSVNTDPTCFK